MAKNLYDVTPKARNPYAAPPVAESVGTQRASLDAEPQFSAPKYKPPKDDYEDDIWDAIQYGRDPRETKLSPLVAQLRSYTDSYAPTWTNTASAGGLFGNIHVPTPRELFNVVPNAGKGGNKFPSLSVNTARLSGARRPWIDLQDQEWLPRDWHRLISVTG